MKKLIMDFGKYKGRDLDDVPASYLLWMHNQAAFEFTKPELWNYIKRNLLAIRMDFETERENRDAEPDDLLGF